MGGWPLSLRSHSLVCGGGCHALVGVGLEVQAWDHHAKHTQRRRRRCMRQVLSLLALLVQKYKYGGVIVASWRLRSSLSFVALLVQKYSVYLLF